MRFIFVSSRFYFSYVRSVFHKGVSRRLTLVVCEERILLRCAKRDCRIYLIIVNKLHMNSSEKQTKLSALHAERVCETLASCIKAIDTALDRSEMRFERTLRQVGSINFILIVQSDF